MTTEELVRLNQALKKIIERATIGLDITYSSAPEFEEIITIAETTREWLSTYSDPA